MSESMFGSPSQLLTTKLGSDSMQTGNGVRMSVPVHQPPPSFADIQFGTIGKPPNLLSRISAPDPGQMSFHSPSPPTLHLPPPVPTHAPVTNSRKLAERIQMGPSQLNSPAKSQNLHPAREPLPAPRIDRNRYVPANPHLIPPIEVLLPTSESNTSQVQALANAPANKVREALTPGLVYPGSFIVTPTTEQSNRNILSSSNPSGSPKSHHSVGFSPQATPSSPLLMPSVSLSPNSKTAGTSSSQVSDVVQPETSTEQVAQDSLSALYARLLEKSKTVSLALPTSSVRTPSPFAPPPDIPDLAASIRSEMNVEDLSAIVLRHPYPQSNSTSSGSLDQEVLPADDGNALTLTNLQSSNMLASRNIRTESLVQVIKKLQSVAEGAVKLQLDANQVFETERMDFDERRKAFEKHMLTREAECEAQMQMFQKKLDELRTREQRLVALEEESRLREETRCARDAQRRAQDDQRRFEDESRRTAIQKEIDEAMKLLQEVKAEKTQWETEKERVERERTLAQNNAVPLQLFADIEPRVEKEDGMTEEEIKAVDYHNKSLVYRRELTENLKKQIALIRQSFDTLQNMKKTRLQASEAERQRVEEDAQRVQTEETEKRVDEEQKLQHRKFFGQQLAHPEAQSQNIQRDRQAEYNRRRAEVLAIKQQTTSENAARIRAERAGHMVVSTTDDDGLEDMNMGTEVDELASPLDHTVPLPGQKGIPPKKPASRTKKTSHSQGTSGNVMLGASTSNGPPSSSMSTPTSSSTAPASYKTPSFVSASTDIGRQVITDAPLFSTQLASEFSLHFSASPPLSDGPLPTSKKVALPSTPKSRTILASDSNEWTEWAVSQQANLSPAQRAANLRHIKKNRHRVEESAAGDRSVKQPDNPLPIKVIKTEELVVGESHGQEQTSSLLEKGSSTRSTIDTMVHISNDNPPSGQAKTTNTDASQINDIPQTSVELVIAQVPSAHLRSNALDGSAGITESVTGLAPNSPSPWVMDASVVRQEWTPDAISSHSEPSESTCRRDPNQRSRQNSQIDGRTRSPESSGFTRGNGTSGESRSQRQRRAPRYSDHYSPPPTSATSSHHRHLEQNEAGAYVHPIPPHPMSPMNSSRKRPAEHDTEYDNRDRRRPRGGHYAPERDYRNSSGLSRQSPAIETEWQRGRSTSLERRSSIHDRLRSPSPSRQIRPHTERNTFERRGRNEGSYRPDYTNAADGRRLSDSGYSVEERDFRGGELLGRISTPGGRGNINRGRGRGKGDVGRGRGGAGGRGRPQQPLPSRPLEERIAK